MRIGRVVGHAPRRPDSPSPCIHLSAPSDPPPPEALSKQRACLVLMIVAVKILPTSNKEKRIPRAKALRIPFTKRNKRKKSLGIRRVTSSSPCLILVTRVNESCNNVLSSFCIAASKSAS
eukprot:1159430-Pelagomonas_calceolata.AAC.1